MAPVQQEEVSEEETFGPLPLKNKGVEFLRGNETGWDLGPFAEVLQCLHLDTPLLEQQNTKKLYGTKNNCVHAPVGQILDPKDTKRPKNPTATFEEPRANTGCWEQKQGLEHAPCTQHHLRDGQNI